jgi:hypothetical protein
MRVCSRNTTRTRPPAEDIPMTRCHVDSLATLGPLTATVRDGSAFETPPLSSTLPTPNAAPVTPAVRSWRDLDGQRWPHQTRPGPLATLVACLLGRGGR